MQGDQRTERQPKARKRWVLRVSPEKKGGGDDAGLAKATGEREEVPGGETPLGEGLALGGKRWHSPRKINDREHEGKGNQKNCSATQPIV